MQRLLELGGDKKYLTFDDLNRELPDNVVSPDDIEDVLQKLDGANITVADSDERLIEQAAQSASPPPTRPKTKKPSTKTTNSTCRPAWTTKRTTPCALPARDGHRSAFDARGGSRHRQTHRARPDQDAQASRARPSRVKELLQIGEDLEAGKLNIRDVVAFSDQAELTELEDKADEYLRGRSKASRRSASSSRPD